MPLLNFQKQFAPRVELGLADPTHPDAKRQTIRAQRKDGRNPKPGQTLYLYTGLRTKGCRKLGEAVCKSSEPIGITSPGRVFCKDLSIEDAKEIAKADGFETHNDFIDFFKETHGLPFYGFLIKW